MIKPLVSGGRAFVWFTYYRTETLDAKLLMVRTIGGQAIVDQDQQSLSHQGLSHWRFSHHVLGLLELKPL